MSVESIVIATLLTGAVFGLPWLFALSIQRIQRRGYFKPINPGE